MKNKDWNEFLELCLQMKTPEELDHFFQLFLTIEEKDDLMKRFLIIKLLLEDKLAQREIAKELGVSISKITRGSNALKIVDPKLIAFLRENV